MRNTKDLIDELHSEADKFSTLQLVVGFQNSSVMIDAGDPHALATLDDAVQHGGEPVGFVASTLEPQADGQLVKLYCRPLDEYADEEWAQEFLDEMVKTRISASDYASFASAAK